MVPPRRNDLLLAFENVIACVYRDGRLIQVIPGRNIVCDQGDKYYAQKACAESPTVDFTTGGIRLGTSATAPTKSDTDVSAFATGTGKAESATFPKTADASSGNTGGGVDVITWKFEWSPGDFTATGLQEGAIVNSISAPTAALCHFLFAAPFNITASDGLVVFINHTANGV